MIYLDYASTTPTDHDLIDRYTHQLKQQFINSDATYEAGVKLKYELENARKRLAGLLSVQAQDILYTASGSEANSLAIKGLAFALRNQGNHLITSTIEHPSVLNSFKQLEEHFGFEVDYVEVTATGVVDLDQLKALIRKDTILVSIMQVNNEVGSIQPLNEIAKIIKAQSKAVFHSDMVQALGKEPLALQAVDAASFSAHKIFGFKGVGFLYKRHHLPLVPLISGGQQEFGWRGGTQPAHLLMSVTDSVQRALAQQPRAHQHVAALNQYLRTKLATIDHLYINSDDQASPFILSFSHLKLGSEIVKNYLEKKNLYVASKSTCSSKLNEPSPVLKAMNVGPARLNGVIRVSLSHLTQTAELDILIQALKEVNEYVR